LRGPRGCRSVKGLNGSRVATSWLFDQQDIDLVQTVNEFAEGGLQKRPERLRKLFNTYLHPRGIKELAASRPQRIAFAVIQLLDSLEGGLGKERLTALAALHDEIVEGTDQLNTGRVLLDKMKQLVRERPRTECQVECAHDFYAAVSGRPRVVRRLLSEAHLLEMSEKWNQVAFDHHVHDAHTKGRKSPTHLVVDAWIKGIREMTVIYYAYTSAEALAELVEAAEVMGIQVQPGIEVSARLRGKYAQFIWCPRGLSTTREYVDFLGKPKIRAFFEEGHEVIRYQTGQVLALLDSFNEHHLAPLRAELGLDLAPLQRPEFLEFVGVGQPAKSHLAEFLHQKLVEHGKTRLPELRAAYARGSEEERRTIRERLERLEALTPEQVAKTVLAWGANPSVENPNLPQDNGHVPDPLRRSCAEVLSTVSELRSGSFITLNPSNLSAADVLEILYEGQGVITHVEIFNLKDQKQRQNPHAYAIAELRHTLNTGNTIACKRLIQGILHEVEKSDEEPAARADRLERLHEILANMQTLVARYGKTPLGSRVGSDSIGRGRARAGMGLAVLPTLPRRAIREFRRHPGTREVIPVETQTVLRTTWIPRHSHLRGLDLCFRALRRIPLVGALGYRRDETYVVLPNTSVMTEHGNILTLGGTPETAVKEFSPVAERAPQGAAPRLRWRYLNTRVKSLLKILIGLLPAFLTFFFTKDFWVLAYLGAFIWFGITGLRNIIQSVLGGGGLFRSEFLHWKDLVSGARIADSLLFTGFSVPLLDYLVKTLLLEQGLAVTTSTAPLALYSVMALANGTYLFTHNTIRGLPRSAAWANFFRSVLSIPIAFALNGVLRELLRAGGLELVAANAALQPWAAVIGKLASDTVAGFIEGTADRSINMKRRHKDLASKLSRLLEVHGRLEILFPEIDVVDRLASPKEFFRTIGKEAQELETQQIINALDLMYFWMYQPRARAVFEHQIEEASPEERRIVLLTQRLLERDRPISTMFLDDLVGKTYDRALAFYLAKREAYLRDMRALAERHGVDWLGRSGGKEGAGEVAEARP
jgi:hypothetical protein